MKKTNETIDFFIIKLIYVLSNLDLDGKCVWMDSAAEFDEFVENLICP